MKAMAILLGVALLASAGLNVFLWNQLSQQRAELESVRGGVAELDSLRSENESLKKQNTAAASGGDASSRELARLRNEINQLRKQSNDVAVALRKEASEAERLRTQLATANTRVEQTAAQVAQLSAEQTDAMKQQAQSTACINNLKQIGLAARLYANAHGNVFPPNFIAMRNELNTPKILFCPAAPGGLQAADWTQLNAATISYQFLNPNGTPNEPQKVLVACPIHGHVGLSDGSVQAKR
jgi:nitrogen fixation-related uncharacterized protein